jgi:hypothetical protein
MNKQIVTREEAIQLSKDEINKWNSYIFVVYPAAHGRDRIDFTIPKMRINEVFKFCQHLDRDNHPFDNMEVRSMMVGDYFQLPLSIILRIDGLGMSYAESDSHIAQLTDEQLKQLKWESYDY